MGVTHCDSVLMILGVSTQMNEKEREMITKQLMKGFNDKAKEAGTSVTGGQSVMNPWPIIGGTAFSVMPKKSVIYPNNSRPGDVLVLTKPLGTQVSCNSAQWIMEKKTERLEKIKDYITEEEIWKAYYTAQKSMSKLNLKAAKLMKEFEIGACTDVTGFGIRGHIQNLAVAQKESLSFRIHSLPVINGMEKVNEYGNNFKLMTGFSAETSGGLLISMRKNDAEEYLKKFKEIDDDGWGWIIGDVISGERKCDIEENPKVILV